MGMRLIVDDIEILEAELADIGNLAFENQPGRGQRLALELLIRLSEMVEIEVGIAQRVDELADLEAGHMRRVTSPLACRALFRVPLMVSR